MKLKILGTLAALMITVAVSAQLGNENDKRYVRAVNRVENMCQTVKLTPEAKQQAIAISYEYFVDYAKAKGDKEILSKVSSKYSSGIKALIPEDQMSAYDTWRKLPKEQRDAKVQR